MEKLTIYGTGVEIHEDAEESRHEDWTDIGKHELSVLRLVFVKPDPKSPYTDLSVYIKPGKVKHLHHTYERIATLIN